MVVVIVGAVIGLGIYYFMHPTPVPGGDEGDGTPLTGVPSAPTGLEATADDGQVTISWNEVSGATSYNIYWSTTPGVTKSTGQKIPGVTSSYTHTGLTNGTTYYYVVTAVNSTGESAESSEVSAVPTGGIYSGGPIRIRSDDQFTPANGVVGGSGTQADPYIIEGWTIDASSCDTSVWPYIKVGIIIDFTSKYFVIRNCQVENARKYGAGISLWVSNGEVRNCVIRNCYSGISLIGCYNVVILGNTIENCEDGISNGSVSSEYITISNNTITGCDHGISFHYLTNSFASGNIVKNNRCGIYISASSNCTVSNNTVQVNMDDGIEITEGGIISENIKISNNDVSNNGGDGIVVLSSHHTISNNTVNGNIGWGIFLNFIGLTDITANYNIISNNTASNNGGDGIHIGFGCNYNGISDNTVSNNGRNGIEVSGVNNTLFNNTCLYNNALGKYSDKCPNLICPITNADFFATWDINCPDVLGNKCLICGGSTRRLPWYYDIAIRDKPNILENNNTYETSCIRRGFCPP